MAIGRGGRRAAFWFGLLVVAVLLVVASLPDRRVKVRMAPVTRGDLRVTVSCSGTLQPPAGGELRSPAAATVAELLAPEGSRVVPGQPLLRLDSPELVSQALEARGELAQLEAEAAAAQSELVRARADAAERARLHAGDERLVAKGALAGSALEASGAALTEAQLALDAAQARMRSLAGAGSRLGIARERARELAARVGALVVRAPFAGVVYGLPGRRGEPVDLGQLVANVADADRPQVYAAVDSPDVPRVAVGQKMVVSFDGLPGRRFDGTVARFDAALRELEGRQVAEVQGAIADPQHLLPQNAPVSVEIVVGERSGVVLVPRGALGRDAAGRYVLVIQDGRAVRREVEIGLIGVAEAEVGRGLQPGEQVVMQDDVTAGQRVSVLP